MTPSSVIRPLHRALKKPLSLAARHLMGTITHVKTSDPVLALTFDDGPHPQYTPRLLDLLKRHQARVTFFFVGQFVAQYPEIIRRAAEDGHVVGIHTWDHSSFPLLTHRERCEQIRKCAKAINPYGSRLFRPPYGQQSLSSRLDLLRAGYQVVTWTHDAGDWRFTNAAEIVDQVLSGIQPGRIIVFHDRIVTALSPVYFNREPTIIALEQLLQKLTGQYRFVTVPELSRYGRLVRENWYYKPDVLWLNGLIGERNTPSRQYPLPVRERRDAPFYM